MFLASKGLEKAEFSSSLPPSERLMSSLKETSLALSLSEISCASYYSKGVSLLFCSYSSYFKSCSLKNVFLSSDEVVSSSFSYFSIYSNSLGNSSLNP